MFRFLDGRCTVIGLFIALMYALPEQLVVYGVEMVFVCEMS
jgi:hypothetical protein